MCVITVTVVWTETPRLVRKERWGRGEERWSAETAPLMAVVSHPPNPLVCDCLTCVDEASWCPLTELFGLVGQRNFNNPGNVPGRSLDPDGMGGDQLTQTSTVRRSFTHRLLIDWLICLLPHSTPAWCQRPPEDHRRSCPRWGWQWPRPLSNPHWDWWL